MNELDKARALRDRAISRYVAHRSEHVCYIWPEGELCTEAERLLVFAQEMVRFVDEREDVVLKPTVAENLAESDRIAKLTMLLND